MLRIILYLLLLAVGSWTLTTNAQSAEYSFHQISTREGLSQSTVQSILLDKRGALWIGTKGGLNRYAQQQLRTYLHQPEQPNSLPDNRILQLAEDSLGTIWVSTANGIATVQPSSGEFTLITRTAAYSAIDTRGGMLFGGDNVILRYDYRQKNMERIYLTGDQENPSNTYRVQSLIHGEDGKVLVGTRQQGIYIFNPSTRQLTPLVTTGRPLLMSLYLATNGYLYASYYGEGVYCYDKDGREVKHYTTANSQLSSDYILDITEHDNRLWLATDGGGLNLLSLDGRDVQILRKHPGDASSLPDNSIVRLYKDREENLWAGSVREGIFIIKPSHIQTFADAPLGTPYGLSHKAITSLYEEPDGSVWIGTDGGGVNHYSPHTGRFKHYPDTYGDKVVSITKFSDSELLLSIYTRGMFLFNKQTGQYRPFTIVNEKVNHEECFYGFLPLAHRVNKDKIYILSYHPWIYHVNEQRFSMLQPADSTMSGEALTLAYANDTLALCRQNNKVYQCSLSEDTFKLCFELEEEVEINALSLDNHGRIWIGSNHGLGYYDLNEGQYHSLPTGLFNHVTFLNADKHNKLWICGDNMLFTYDTENDLFTAWNTSDGYTPNEILPSFQQSAHPDFLYLGGNQGLVCIRSREVDFQNIVPEVHLADLYLDGMPLSSQQDKHPVTVPWNYHSLSVAVQVKAKDLFQKNLIRYIIRKDKEEHYQETYNTTLNLATLLPGTYHLLASCLQKDGTYTAPTHLIDITITPPWYRSTWFLVLSAMILLAIILLLFYRMNQRKEKAIRQRMKSYKHQMDEEKINFLINVNHELRTPLTLIYAPLRRLADKGTDGISTNELHQLFRTLYNQALRMKNIINMVLDLNRLESGIEQMKIQQHPLNEWVSRAVADFDYEWKAKRIHVVLQPDERIGQVWFDEWKCQIVLSNLLANALKFSGEDTTLTISTQLQEGKVRVSVSDQGIGLGHLDIDKLFTRFYEGKHSQQGSGIGLSYAKMLMELHGGNLYAFNNPDRGATFYFELPLDTASAPSPLPGEETPNGLPAAAPDAASLPDIDTRRHTLLLVEDEDELRNYLQQALKEKFKQVYAFPNAPEALEFCRHTQPSLIVSDVMMPGMNGYEFCRQVKSDLTISHIPVILLTARCDEESTRHGYKQGADFYMSKPFELDFLVTIISNQLRSREAKRQRFSSPQPIATPQEATISNRDEEFLLKLNSLINDNLATEDIRVEYLTDHMAMSRASLYNKVKQLTGLGVNDYINRLRIERAAELLIHTEKSINDIASEVGFTYPRYFSTLFKKVKGVTPSQFKEGQERCADA